MPSGVPNISVILVVYHFKKRGIIMNKKDYKRLALIKEELGQLELDMEDSLRALENAFIKRDTREVKELEIRLSFILDDIALRRAIREEIELPKHYKIEGGFQEVQDFIKDNDWDKDETKELMEEYASMVLTDLTNHNLYGFTCVAKGNDIYITSIRWNENQLIEQDLKDLKKRKIKEVKNGFVKVYKHAFFTNSYLVVDRKWNIVRSVDTFKGLIRWLEDHYYM